MNYGTSCVGGPLDGESVITDDRSFDFDLPDGWEPKGGKVTYILVNERNQHGAGRYFYKCFRHGTKPEQGKVVLTQAMVGNA